MQNSLKFAVVGSVLVGTLLAIHRKKSGHTAHVDDCGPGIRTVAFSGRSINVVMSIYTQDGLMDGYYVENFVDLFQNLMNE